MFDVADNRDAVSRFKSSRRSFLQSALVGASIGLSGAFSRTASAEASEIRLANQYGFGHLPLTIMKDQKIIEKHAAAAGIPLTVSWINTQGSATYEALVSGSVDVISAGLPGVFNLWDKTRGAVRAIGPAGAVPMVLVTRNPKVLSVKDFTDADRIAVPTVRVSPQAIFLQQAAAEAFGPTNFNKLDHLTVSLSHPDALAAFLSGGEVNAHFSIAPFLAQELKVPGTRAILDSGETPNGPTTQVVLASTQKFREQNPKLFAIFFAAYQETLESIAADSRRTAESYLRESGDKTSLEDTTRQLTELRRYYDIVPRNTLALAKFMNDIGTIKTRPATWKEFYFPEIHNLAGS